MYHTYRNNQAHRTLWKTAVQPLAPQNQSNQENPQDVLDRAIAISTPVVKEDGRPQGALPTYTSKVVRRVQVPYTREVKVPTKTVKIVPATEVRKVPVLKKVTVPGWQEVEEEYVEWEEREAVRQKEVWVKKLVDETYIERVPVKKTRTVRKAAQVVKEVEELTEVEVPTTKAIEVDGFRIDQVQDTKVVEVEELHEFELRPVPKGKTVAGATDIGRLQGHLARSKGPQVFEPGHPVPDTLEEDDDVSDLQRGLMRKTQGPADQGQGAGNGSNNGSEWYRNADGDLKDAVYNVTTNPDTSFNQLPTRGFNKYTSYGVLPPRQMYDQTPVEVQKLKARAQRPAGAGGIYGQHNSQASSGTGFKLGISVKNSHTVHTDGSGVLVTRVEDNGRAAFGGVQTHDLIYAVNGVPVSTTAEFLQVVRAAQGNKLQFALNRHGSTGVQLWV